MQSCIKAYSFSKKPYNPDQDELIPEELVPEEPEEFDYRFRNEYKCLRVGMVRRHLWHRFDIEKICRAYGEWVDTDEWLQLSMKLGFVDGSFKTENVFVPCVKRGNDAYQARVNKRIADMGDFEDWPLDASGGRNDLKSYVLFVTLSQDTKRFVGKHRHPEQKAWMEIGKEFNAWASAIRQKFGRFAFFRVWESTEQGFPHVHAILVFEKKKFPGFMHKDKSGRWKMRIREKEEFAKPWHSHVDVRGVVRFKRGMSELLKYLKKDIGLNQKKKKAFFNSPKGRKTLALTWFFNKRAFAVSGFFSDLTADLHNSNIVADISRVYQADLYDLPVVSVAFTLIDIVPARIVAAMGGDG